MGPTRRVRTIAKKIGLRIGAPRRMPTSTTTVAASTSNTRKKEARRSVVVIASAKTLPSPAVLSPAGLFEDSVMVQPPHSLTGYLSQVCRATGQRALSPLGSFDGKPADRS